MALDPQSTLIQLESLKLEKTPPAIKPRRSRSAWCVLLVAVSCLAVGFVGGALFARLTRDGGDDDDVAADASAADAAADAAVDADGADAARRAADRPRARRGAAPADRRRRRRRPPRRRSAATTRRRTAAPARAAAADDWCSARDRCEGSCGATWCASGAPAPSPRPTAADARADGGPDGDAAAVGRGADGRAEPLRDGARLLRPRHAEPPLVVFIVYDLPNRDCHAYASNGEICCAYNDDGTCDYDNSATARASTGRETNIFDTTSMFVYVHSLDEYKTTYVDPFAAILAEFEGVVPVALILEPDSLPNFATNLGDRAANIGTKNAYELGIAYAVEALKAAAPSAHIYLDAGHGGWLGWEDNLESFASTVASLGVEDHLRGFATNTANYQPLGEPCADGVDCITGPGASSACCDDPCGLLSQPERARVRLLVDAMAAAMPGFAPKSSSTRAATGTPARGPTARPGATRAALALARPCGQSRPDVVDAYFWLKTPGESDGCTALLPSADDEWVSDGACPRFDQGCASVDSIGTAAGEPYAPEAGHWYDYQIKMLAEFADM
ncbi:cellulose 1,4-beta-cellobiosidase [Aureococcus anophagefferens]|nr:cellulose 1,4-beta-cellobiosidase [Aureococcus anophagefferens]